MENKDFALLFKIGIVNALFQEGLITEKERDRCIQIFNGREDWRFSKTTHFS